MENSQKVVKKSPVKVQPIQQMSEEDSKVPECMICAYPMDKINRVRTVTVCTHAETICSICFLRIRALQRNFHCPTCKQEIDHVIATNEDKDYSQFTIWGENIGEDYVYDQRSQMFFPKDYHRNKIEKLWQLQCNVCQTQRRDFKGLKGHLSAEHNLQLCMLCVEHKQVFPSEQKIYTKAEYDRHMRFGDNDGSIGHPNCEFCKTRYYDTTALFLHLTKEHYTCFLCEQQGNRFRYFHTYQHLEVHFKKDHHLCEEPSCLERRFVAFGNEIDLRSHQRAYHPHMQVNRSIPIQLTYRSRNAPPGQRNNNNSQGDNSSVGYTEEGMERSSSCYEGGLGGRAQQGIWQVEVQMLSNDPRDPNRNFLHPSANPGSGDAPAEDFPALAPIAGAVSANLVTNRWVSTKTGGKVGKGPAASTSTSASATPTSTAVKRSYAPLSNTNANFPSLPTNPTTRNLNPTTVGSGKKFTQALEIQRQYSSLSTLSFTPSAPTMEESLSAYIRPAKKKASTSLPLEMAADDYEAELTRALNESLRQFEQSHVNTAFINPPIAPSLSDFEAFPPPPPLPVSSAPPASAPLSAGGEVKSSSTSSKSTQSVKKKKAVISEDWTAALKSVGMAVPPKKKAVGSKLKVIKASDPAADQKLQVVKK